MATKVENITKKVKANKDLLKRINSQFDFIPTEDERILSFIEHGQRYVKAIKERRVINTIARVSNSGMSRTIKFVEMSGKKNGYGEHNVMNFFSLFKILGYSEARNLDGHFSIGGCGMDMIFHTNYTNMHRLQRLGFISKKQCGKLAQMTPHTI